MLSRLLSYNSRFINEQNCINYINLVEKLRINSKKFLVQVLLLIDDTKCRLKESKIVEKSQLNEVK
jgi:hypothetical protein